jgi:hypothetical protein
MGAILANTVPAVIVMSLAAGRAPPHVRTEKGGKGTELGTE